MTEQTVGGHELSPEVLDQVEGLARRVFGDEEVDSPMLGMTEQDVLAANIHELIHDPENTIVTLEEEGQTIGFSVAVPYEKMRIEGPEKTKDTAYIYYSGIDPNRQNQGLVKKLNDDMLNMLSTKGYKFATRDSVMDQDYAEKVEKAYDKAIVERYDHERWPDVGPQRFFRIDLAKI